MIRAYRFATSRTRCFSMIALMLSSLTAMAFVFVLPKRSAQAHDSAASNVRQESQTCSSCKLPAEDHFLNFAYFVESGDLTSTLALNNNTRDPQDVRLTIFNHQGDLFQLPPLSLPAQQTSRFSLHDLLKDAKGDFNSGNLRVFYHAMAMGVTGQVTVTSAKHRYSFDSYPTEAMMFASTRLDGILWLPDKRTEASVALTNTASTALTVTISSGQDPRKQEKNIALNPRETSVVNLREFVAEPVRGPSATLLSLTHNGAPGDLITTGFALNDQSGFASNLLFVDRATATSSKLAGAHVRIGQAAASDGFPAGTTFSAPLVVANPSDLPSEAHVAVDYTIDAAPHRVELAPFTLAAQEIKQIDLARELARRGVSGPVDEAGVDISYSGHAGDVIGRLTSVDGSGDYTFDVPIKDPLAGINRVGGGYPWRLDQGYITILHLKNTIDKAVTAIVQVRYEGGNYNPELIKLAPYQTVAIDIRKLRDSQQKDIRGRVMPKDVTSGQVIWYERELGSLIGRAEIFNLDIGVADSFSCVTGCTCPPNFDSASMSPSFISSGVGDFGALFSPRETTRDCAGDIYGPFGVPNITSWSSTSTSVATVDSGGNVTCVGVGASNILATFLATVYGGPPGSCYQMTVNPTASGGLDVRPTLQAIDPQRKVVGSTGAIHLTGRGFGNAPVVNVGGGITASVQSASDTLITVNFDIVLSATPGNHAVTVTTDGGGGRTSNSINFFVQVPTAVEVLEQGISTTRYTNPLPNGCPSAQVGSAGPYGMQLRIKYQVLDQDSPRQPVREMIEVRENLRNFIVDGQAQGSLLDVPVTQTGRTEADGTFVDNGVGAASAAPFTQVTFTQEIFIRLSDTQKPIIRTNSFSHTGRFGCGSATNGNDITVNVPC
jgi:hypothetical protein